MTITLTFVDMTAQEADDLAEELIAYSIREGHTLADYTVER